MTQDNLPSLTHLPLHPPLLALQAAARREALFERLSRQRAEALLGGARQALVAAKARLRVTQRTVEAVRNATVSRGGDQSADMWALRNM